MVDILLCTLVGLLVESLPTLRATALTRGAPGAFATFVLRESINMQNSIKSREDGRGSGRSGACASRQHLGKHKFQNLGTTSCAVSVRKLLYKDLHCGPHLDAFASSLLQAVGPLITCAPVEITGKDR